MATMKVKPWGKDQGDFVVIEADDFNPEFHKEFTATELAKIEKAEAKKAEGESDGADDAAAPDEPGE